MIATNKEIEEIENRAVRNFAEKLKQRITDDNGNQISTLTVKGIEQVLKGFLNKNKSTKQLMAEYIQCSDCACCTVCANEKDCNEKYALADEKGEKYEPKESDCINGIINYFERQKCKS